MSSVQVVRPREGSPLLFATIEEFCVGTFRSMLGSEASADVRQVRPRLQYLDTGHGSCTLANMVGTYGGCVRFVSAWLERMVAAQVSVLATLQSLHVYSPACQGRAGGVC